MRSFRGSPILPKASHRSCIRELFCGCLEEHLPNATVSCADADCWKRTELNRNFCGVNVMLGNEQHDATRDTIGAGSLSFDSLTDTIGMGASPKPRACETACYGVHTRMMEVIIEIWAIQCSDVMDTLDDCICGIESLIAQKQCMMRMISRLTYTGTQEPEQRGDERTEQVAYTAMRYEAEYTFDPITCTFIIPKCR